MSNETIMAITPEMFTEREKSLVTYGELAVTVFEFTSGVCGLRMQNQAGEVVMLPFQGQQIWSACFDGRSLTMRSQFSEPQPTQDYLANYGGFLVHCGATAMGCPGPKDTHPLHGELPNARYQEALVTTGCDENGHYVQLSGRYRHTVAFTCDYIARPTVRLYEGATTLQLSMEFTNQARRPLDIMYLAHINFLPIDNSRLLDSAPCDVEHMRVRTSVPQHVRSSAEYRAFLQRVARNPELLNVLKPTHPLDPEVVMSISHLADRDGWAHSLQLHPDGYASYVKYQPAEMKYGIRWLWRTQDEDALGLSSPATAEPEGYSTEKKKGNMLVLPGKGSLRFSFAAGLVRPPEAKRLEAHIDSICRSYDQA